MRLPVHGLACLSILFVFMHATGLGLAADGPPHSRAKLKAKQVEFNKLLKRYRYAGPRIEQRQQIVDEAIALGAPFTVALRTMIDQQSASVLQKYRREFSARVGNARNLTPVGVVAASNQLSVFRQELARSSQFALQLEKRSTGADPDEDGANPTDAAQGASEFEQRLTKIEADLILQWLVNKGLGRLSSGKAALVVEVNRRRAQKKLAPLEVDYKLCAVARDHSLDLKQMHFFSHASKLPGKKTFADRARRFGTTAAAENIASCASASEAMAMWMLSPPHKRNIMGASLRRIGIGQVGRKFTIMFGH